MYLWTVLAYSSPILHTAHLKWRDDPVRLSNMVTTRKVFAAAAGTVCLLLNFSPVYADNSSTGTVSTDTASLRIFEIDMNDQNPLATLKQKVIEERAGYDAAVSLDYHIYACSAVAVVLFLVINFKDILFLTRQIMARLAR